MIASINTVQYVLTYDTMVFLMVQFGIFFMYSTCGTVKGVSKFGAKTLESFYTIKEWHATITLHAATCDCGIEEIDYYKPEMR